MHALQRGNTKVAVYTKLHAIFCTMLQRVDTVDRPRVKGILSVPGVQQFSG